MKMKVLFLLLFATIAIAEEPQTTSERSGYELGLRSGLQATYSTSLGISFGADVSKALTKTYQVGILSDVGYSSLLTIYRLLATATVHFTDDPWEKAWFFKPMLGVAGRSSGGAVFFGIGYGVVIGKRIPLTEKIIYRPTIEFSRDAMNQANILIEILGFSLFIDRLYFF